MNTKAAPRRPRGVTALAVFFAAGAVISGVSGVSLLTPGGMLDPLWRLNPRAEAAFGAMGGWAPVLLGAVCAACATAAIGLWRLRGWGRWVAIGLLVTNLLGDTANAALGTEPQAAAGIPVVIVLLIYLARPAVRAAFRPV